MFTSDRQRLTALALILLVTPPAILISTIYVLYTQAMDRWETWLADAARQQTVFIQALVQHEKTEPALRASDDWQGDVLSQVLEAQQRFAGFGGTGEYLLAWQEGDRIRFLHQRRNAAETQPTTPAVTSGESSRAQAMAAALRGESGVGIFRDYRGASVLAAHRPVTGTPWGIVVKVDLAEVRAPFVRYGLAAIGIALCLLPLAFLLFRRISLTIIANLEANAARLRDVLDSAAEGICDVSLDRCFTFVNPAARRMLGWSPEEMVGVNSHQLCHHSREDGSRYPEEECPLTATIADGKVRQTRGDLFWRKDGSSFFVDCTIAPKYKDGELAGGVLVFQDVTSRVVAERGITQANLDLSRKNQEMEQFIYMVSHDLKSPLVTVQGFTNHIRRDTAAQRLDRIGNFADRIENAVARMKSLIDGLLDLSRIGRVVAPPCWVDTHDLFAQLAVLYQAELDSRRIHLVLEDELPAVYGDQVRITQVFENLLVNAMRYGSSAPEPTIRVGHETADDEIRIFVRDNGAGIAPEYHDRIFQLFQRLSADKDSTGVGLAVVRKVMEVHEGRAWVESTPGRGATFWLAFPHRGQSATGKADAAPLHKETVPS